jgi:prevent-host-death family protein
MLMAKMSLYVNNSSTIMQTVAISTFRAHLPEFLSRVESGETLALTVRGKEVARIIPPPQAREHARRELESIRQRAWIGDIISPLEEPWEAVE